ncbi:MAG TPA: phosphodiester glycosidase family protein, partial [Candidatus Saccharimonadales bacterium]|nr:phosphodiester glycosidase family protein [Candidatus Saccharimonadales bacterium]
GEPPASRPAAHAWKEIAPGMELGQFPVKAPGGIGEATITILRADPARWELQLLGAGAEGGPSGLTAHDWGVTRGLAAVINAGMFATDYRTHVGYMRSGGLVHNSRVAGSYHSVAAFGPTRPDLPEFRIFDLDVPGVTMDRILADYASAVQNLRLIKRPGENRWPEQEKRWSEAALAEDDRARVLFVHCRSPYSMHDFNEELLGLDIGIVAAQHLEGGPEAQLYVAAGETRIELVGSYETAFREDDANRAALPLPNVLGLRWRATPDPGGSGTSH